MDFASHFAWLCRSRHFANERYGFEADVDHLECSLGSDLGSVDLDAKQSQRAFARCTAVGRLVRSRTFHLVDLYRIALVATGCKL